MAGYETAIVRLRGWGAGMATSGLGLLVGPEQVVTCAHVVNAVLGRSQREQAPPGQFDSVEVEFPMLPGPPMRVAKIVAWSPPSRNGAGSGDVAGLVLTEEAPGGTEPARFAAAAPEPGAPLRVFGYPGNPAGKTGMWVDVNLEGDVGGMTIQVESRSGQIINAQPGYDGSPVWNQSTGEAVGLLQAGLFYDEPERGPYLLLSPAVAQAWEQQFDYLLVPENPYRGLDVFTAERNSIFFGRDADIEALIALVRSQSVVLIVGPSGVGKSSLMQAGLIPALQRQQQWSVALIRFGQDPWLRLAAGLLSAQGRPDASITLMDWRREIDRLRAEGFGPAARFLRSEGRPLLVVVDQLEELLATVDPPDRDLLLDLLLPPSDAAEEACRLVLAMRADFLPALLSIPGFNQRLNERLYLLSPLTMGQMREAVERPAADRAVAFETGLVDQILSDAGGGPLPLLEFTLTKLWETQRRRTLTFVGYHKIGGVRGTLGQFAEEQVAQLTSVAAEVLDRVLLRLVRTPGGADLAVRQRIFQSEVTSAEWAVVQHLAAARLVVLDAGPADSEPYAELAHESLIIEWQRLRNLIAENTEFLNWLAWVEQRAADGDPLPEARIAEARRWLDLRSSDVPGAIKRFIESSEIAAEMRLRELRDVRDLAEMTREQAEEAARTAEAVSPITGTGQGRGVRGRKAKLFVSYSHKDERHRELLEIHLSSLRREGVVAVWHDLKITPGEEWRPAIEKNLDTADCVLLLVTPDFLASDYCYSVEMQHALEKHREGRILVIPVIVRPVDWERTPLGELQALPKGAKPVVEWAVRDRAWLSVAEGLRRALIRVHSS